MLGIREIDFYSMDLLGGEVFTMLGPFFKNNHNLTNIYINSCDFGDEGARLFALALGSITNKSLKEVTLSNNNIVEEGMVDVITALSTHPNMELLELIANHLRKNGCVALATLLRYSAKELRYLYLANTEINDEGIEALVPALKKCRHLRSLNVDNNPSITTKGWQNLAAILGAPSTNSKIFSVDHNNVDDEVVAMFASALASNCMLERFYFHLIPSITTIGWQSIVKLLGDTSSVNATFLSNHTLQYLGNDVQENDIGPLLLLNEREDKREVATIKILKTTMISICCHFLSGNSRSCHW